jgi:penicillin-binding protein 1A
VGFDQERSLGGQEVGGRAAAPIWLYFMEKFLENRPVENFPVPQGLVFVKVNPKTGLPARAGETGTIFECFLENAHAAERADEAADEKEEFFR